MEECPGILPKRLWAYAYEIVPPQHRVQVSAIRALLVKEHADAHRAARTWAGKVVCTPKVTHILVVSDSPDQRLEVNHRLERLLRGLNAVFSLTVPMALDDDDTPLRGTAT